MRSFADGNGNAQATGLGISDSLFGNSSLGTDSAPDVVAIRKQIEMLVAEMLETQHRNGRRKLRVSRLRLYDTTPILTAWLSTALVRGAAKSRSSL